MTFVKGVSGNPNGRPALGRDFRSRCQMFMTKSGWAALEKMATDKTSPHHFRAIELIGAYAYGRPTQVIAADPDSDAPLVHVTVLFDRADDDQLALPG